MRPAAWASRPVGPRRSTRTPRPACRRSASGCRQGSGASRRSPAPSPGQWNAVVRDVQLCPGLERPRVALVRILQRQRAVARRGCRQKMLSGCATNRTESFAPALGVGCWRADFGVVAAAARTQLMPSGMNNVRIILLEACRLSPCRLGQPPVACRHLRLSPVACRLSPVACRLSPVACRPFTCGLSLSPVVCRLSPVACRLSPVACRLSPVAWRLWPAACRLSRSRLSPCPPVSPSSVTQSSVARFPFPVSRFPFAFCRLRLALPVFPFPFPFPRPTTRTRTAFHPNSSSAQYRRDVEPRSRT